MNTKLAGHPKVDAIGVAETTEGWTDSIFVARAWYSQMRYKTKRGTSTSQLACHFLGLLTEPFWVKDKIGYPVAINLSWKTSSIYLTTDLWEMWGYVLNATTRVLKEEMRLLSSVGLVELRPPKPHQEIVKLLGKKTPQQPFIPAYNNCSWCKCSTFVLHEHHYPIPRAKGGIDVIKICPNCHSEFHALVDAPELVLTPKVFEGVELTKQDFEAQHND